MEGVFFFIWVRGYVGISLPNSGMYRWEFHWRFLDNGRYMTPWTPIFQYDLIYSTNKATSEPSGYDSDDNQLTNWASFQGQSFVVPEVYG